MEEDRPEAGGPEATGDSGGSGSSGGGAGVAPAVATATAAPAVAAAAAADGAPPKRKRSGKNPDVELIAALQVRPGGGHWPGQPLEARTRPRGGAAAHAGRRAPPARVPF
jgi:hypothetical protein